MKLNPNLQIVIRCLKKLLFGKDICAFTYF